MPPHTFAHINRHASYLLWHIDEPEYTLLAQMIFSLEEEAIWKVVKHPTKRREWLAARVALKHLLHNAGYAYTGLYKDKQGKPYLKKQPFHVSIAHCFPFALALFNTKYPIGGDIQLAHKKLNTVKDKFLNKEEIKASEHDAEKYCIYWCVKEAAYKMYGNSAVSLKNDITICPFIKKQQGTVTGTLYATPFTAEYIFKNNYAWAWCNANHMSTKHIKNNHDITEI